MSLARCAAIVALAACGRRDAAPPPPAIDRAAHVDPGGHDAPAATGAPPPCDGRFYTLAPGVTGERHHLAITSALPSIEPCLDVVRVDVAQHRLQLIMASRDGVPRPIPRWVAERGAIAAINAGMFGEDHRGLGLLHDRAHVDRNTDNPRYGGWLLFDPLDPADPPARIVGRDCPGVDAAAVRARYRAAIQSYRLLGCDGEALAWADDKHYSAASFGLDRDGRLVMLHTRAPFRMGELAAALVAADLGLVGALYAEGGPEATVAAGPWLRVGSYETGYWEDDSNHAAWDVPNVLLAVPAR